MNRGRCRGEALAIADDVITIIIIIIITKVLCPRVKKHVKDREVQVPLCYMHGTCSKLSLTKTKVECNVVPYA